MLISLVKKHPLHIFRLTAIFFLSFVLFFLLHDYFMVTIQTELNYLYEVISQSTGITNIRPSLITLFSTTIIYAVLLWIIFSATQSSIWFEAKVKELLSQRTTGIILGVSALFGLLFALILPGLPVAITFASLTIFFFSIAYSKIVIIKNKKRFFSFFVQYSKISLIAVIGYIILIFLHFLISFALLQTLQRNPYDNFGLLLYILKWFFYVIVFQYSIHSSAYVTSKLKKNSCSKISIGETFKQSFMSTFSYITSGIFICYSAVLFIVGTLLLQLSYGNVFNFIFMTIFFLGGFIVWFIYEVDHVERKKK